MNAPDINAEPCRCAKCGGVLRIVCDAHGEDFLLVTAPLPPQAIGTPVVPHRRRIAGPSTTPAPKTTRRREESLRQRLLDFVSTDESNPTTAVDVMAAFGISNAHANVELSGLRKTGQLKRIAWGKYVRGLV